MTCSLVARYSFSLTTRKFSGTLCMGTRFWYGKFPGNYDDVFCVRACLSWRDPRSKFESESKLWEIIGNDLEKTLNFMSVWALLIWSLRVDIVIFTRKRKEKTYRRDPFQGKDIFHLLRIGCYHGAKSFANYTWLNPPFSTFFCDGDKESSLEGTYTFLVLLSDWIKRYWLRHVFSYR